MVVIVKVIVDKSCLAVANDGRQFFQGSVFDYPGAFEGQQQFLFCHRADVLDFIQLGVDLSLAAKLAVESDAKSVRLIAQLLDKLQTFRLFRSEEHTSELQSRE